MVVGRTKEKSPRNFRYVGQRGSWRRPTLPLGLPSSTIGSKELNFRVREGIGCDLLDITTGNGGCVSRRSRSNACVCVLTAPFAVPSLRVALHRTRYPSSER